MTIRKSLGICFLHCLVAIPFEVETLCATDTPATGTPVLLLGVKKQRLLCFIPFLVRSCIIGTAQLVALFLASEQPIGRRKSCVVTHNRVFGSM